MTSPDYLRIVSVGALAVIVVMIAYIMRKAVWYRPIGWIMLLWATLNLDFNVLLIMDNFIPVVTDARINELSQMLRMYTYGSVIVILVILILEIRKKI
jgi:hypothetical protein